jgi:hypothetical protein
MLNFTLLKVIEVFDATVDVVLIAEYYYITQVGKLLKNDCRQHNI